MSLAKLLLTAQVSVAWRQGDTAATYEVGLAEDVGVPKPKNPYHPLMAPVSHEAWRRGFTGHPMDERGGFVEAAPEEVSA